MKEWKRLALLTKEKEYQHEEDKTSKNLRKIWL
jgi:hypothetical protein